MPMTEPRRCAGTTRRGTPCRTLVKPWQVYCEWHRPGPLDEVGLREVMLALRELGVLKADERQSVKHSRADCPVFTDRTRPCICGTAVRIEWADHDEVAPGRKITTTKAE